MGKSKWIPVESPEEPASNVARRALESRLNLVWRHLPTAAREASERVEHVHQLRVASRRAWAALQAFEDFVPEKRRRWFRKQLKRVRRAAGDARDLDVLGLRLLESCAADPSEACGTLLERIRQRRRKAQKPIRQIHRKLASKGYRQRVQKLVAKTAWPSDSREVTIGEFARQQVSPVLDAFFAAGRADLHDIELLHQFRIAGKKLRYVVEIFSGALPAEFHDQLYPQVAAIQDQLGAINDHASALTQLDEWSAELRTEEEQALHYKLIDEAAAGLHDRQAAFLREWNAQQASELEAAFREALDTAA